MNAPSRHILLADDNQVNRKVLQHMLSRLGHTVDPVASGQEALEKASSSSYDLIFMDMMMPVMDGLEATRAIRRQENGKRRTPIVAVTANVERRDEQACADAGMDAFLTKPFTFDQVRACLDRFDPARFEVPGSEGLAPSILKTFVETMGADDTDFVLEVLRDLLEEANRVRAAIHAAIEQQRAFEVAQHAHSLKSAAAEVGAQELSGICRTMESAAKKDNLEDVQLAFSRFDGALNLVRRDVDAFRAQHASQHTSKHTPEQKA